MAADDAMKKVLASTLDAMVEDYTKHLEKQLMQPNPFFAAWDKSKSSKFTKYGIKFNGTESSEVTEDF